MRRVLWACAVVLVASAAAQPTLACGDGPMGVNLVATPSLKAALREAYLAANPRVSRNRVGSPVPGRTYYGSHLGTRYAVATFSAYPTIFRADSRGRWHAIRQTHGGICTNVVPSDLIVYTWWLKHWNSRCFVEPS